jgi:hypothetical protein
MCTPAGEIPDSIGCMTALTVLTMAQNQLVGEIPEGVGNLPQLTMLLLSHNQLSGRKCTGHVEWYDALTPVGLISVF